MFAALGEEAEKSVMQQACQRHGYVETLGRGQRKPDVLVTEWCGEAGRLVLALSDEGTVGFVCRCVE
jgi:hypothetical protein